MTTRGYLPSYSDSRALVIGINKYKHVGPLAHAVNDARAVAEVLESRFGFAKTKIELLLDENADRATILRTFLRYADAATIGPDDRILVFFAGHGHTVPGRRGEIGYLVPVDGISDDLSTLIRWDELTRNAELIPAKHVLFLMDACYGGLALTRTTIPPGSARLLKDMLQRYARQVLTAGKADEVVSDAGGTRHGHSIFTSHLLDGLEGAAAPAGKILTGHGLMAYVYDKVGNDPHSRQTPHFGFFDGDGDFIFDTSALAELKVPASSVEPDMDILITAPAVIAPAQKEDTLPDLLKRLIPSSSDKIRLNDLLSTLLRQAADRLSPDKFPVNQPFSPEEFLSRIEQYEDAVSDLTIAVILLAHWGQAEHIALLEKLFARIAEFEKPQGGQVIWIRLYWYPVLVLMYAAGISALAANRYDTLRASLLTKVITPRPLFGKERSPIILAAITELTEIAEYFKKLRIHPVKTAG